jgi:hypothetical protein
MAPLSLAQARVLETKAAAWSLLRWRGGSASLLQRQAFAVKWAYVGRRK